MDEIDKSHNGTEQAPRRANPLKILVLAAVAVLVLYYVVGKARHEHGESAIAWRGDFAQAAAQAQAGNKVIFADFSASWCPPCQQMEHTVFQDKQFAAALEQAAVPLRVDVDQPAGQQLAARHNVQMIPTYIVLSADDTALARSGGIKLGEQLLGLVQQASQKAMAGRVE